jgi:hypothetical protein
MDDRAPIAMLRPRGVRERLGVGFAALGGGVRGLARRIIDVVGVLLGV